MTHSYNLSPLTNGWIDFHDNGIRPSRGRTRFGLVIDLNNSKERLNINFEVLSDEAYVGLLDSPNLSDAQKDVILRCASFYVDNGGAETATWFMAPAKRNVQSGRKDNAGKPLYKLEPEYNVAAILDVSEGEDDPTVLLFWGNEVVPLTSWYAPLTANHTIKARCDLR